jgi:hypothetical protein
MRTLTRIAALSILAAGSVWATTLEQLSVAQMIEQSTAIVRAKVQGSFTASRNGTVYTFYRLQVVENLKSQTQPNADVAVPGGSLSGIRHHVAGAPELKAGSEYVLFLWTSKSGLTQIIGLSQGAFDIQTGASGDAILLREPVTEPMLDAQGRTVRDAGVSLGLSDLRARIRREATR